MEQARRAYRKACEAEGGRMVCLLAVCFVVLSLVSAFAVPSPGMERAEQERGQVQTFTLVQASVSTAGPYGESWHLTVLQNGEASLQVYYATGVSGSLMARFTLPGEAIAAIGKTIDSAGFFALPGDISPESLPLHQPDLRLVITVGGKKHTVELYDPDQIAKDPRAKKFLAIWDQVFAGLPLKPKW